MIINSLIDTDLYTFTVCYLYLQKFPRTVVTYKFNDRNALQYSEEFVNELKEEVKSMQSLKFTDDDEKFMRSKCYYLPNWFYTFLKGYRFDPNEVSISLDEDNLLDISITGYAWRTVMWEVPLLAIISELYHKHNGDAQKYYKKYDVILNARNKCKDLIQNGLVFNSDLGIFLYDTYGWEAFQKNFSKKHALLFTGLRVDSGDNFEMVDKIIAKYESLGIDPSTKQVTFSNGLSTKEAIEIHKYVNGRVKDNYGIGTHFTCDIKGVKPMNIVIKLYEAQLTEKTEKRKCIKLSDDFGKTSGDISEVNICCKTLKLL